MRTNKPSDTRPSSDGSVALPVLGQTHDAVTPRRVRRSRMGRRRAAVLILIHIAFLAHLLHWKVRGKTISPVEPSESMQTLEQGLVNAGFIFFVAAILSTLIFGRFFCGWGCHIVALQDLCGWMLKKVGIRPSPFRSRLLMYAPLALALYMFVWPSLKRLFLPWLTNRAPAFAAWFGPPTRFPDEGFTNHLFTEDFWATFASVPVAIPFLFICGFATVYFLGAKGFCTYGCPYGGFFAPADRLAPGRILVDPDKCEGCGHCTAVCTSNVRVHEEIREYGGVVDPGCMKCMDCVSVCPNNALSFGFARPSAFKGAPRHKPIKPRLDTTRGQDFILAVAFIAVFLAFRGQYDIIPMLMAMGMAGVGAFLAWKSLCLVRRRDVRVVRIQIKRKGRLTPAGVGFGILMLAGATITIHSLAVSQYRWRGNAEFTRLRPNAQSLLSDLAAGVSDADAARARRGAALLERSLIHSTGGIGLLDNSTARWRAAVLTLMAGDADKAETILNRLTSNDATPATFVVYHSSLLTALGRSDEAISLLSRRLARIPQDWQVREARAPAMMAQGRAGIDEVIREAEAALEEIPASKSKARARTTLTLGMATRATGDAQAALPIIRKAHELDPTDRACMETLAGAVLIDGNDPDEAAELLRRVFELDKRRLDAAIALGRALALSGNWDAVSTVFDDAQSAGAPTAEVSMAQMSLGVELLRRDKEKATALIRSGWGRAPEDIRVREYAALVRDRIGIDIRSDTSD